MTSLRIHLIHTQGHECPYMAFWALGGRAYRVRVWSFFAWELTPDGERPPDATPIAAGMMAVEPVGRGRAGPDHFDPDRPARDHHAGTAHFRLEGPP